MNNTCEDFAEKLKIFLLNVLNYAGLGLSLDVSIRKPETVIVNFTGDDIPLLLDYNAELLDTLEYLASCVFARNLHGSMRMRFDADNHRSIREYELTLMAETIAERVKRSLRSFTLNAMTPWERRIIHTTLSNDTQIKTESIGRGENRKIVIYPL